MAIETSEVETGYLYRTPNNQERVVLGCNPEGKVVYAPRGGNVKNEFDNTVASNLERFAEACSEKLYKVELDKFNKIH